MTILVPQTSQLVMNLVLRFLRPRRLLLSIVVVSPLALSACQTVPYASNPESITIIRNSTETINTAIDQNDDRTDESIIDYADDYSDTEDDSDYPIEPYIPPIQSDDYSSPATSYDEDSDNESIYGSEEFEPIPAYYPPIPTPSNNSNNPVIAPPKMPSHSDLLERARQNSQQQNRTSTSDRTNLPAFRNLMQVGTTQLQAGNLTAAENTFTRAQRLAPKSSAVYFYLSQVALKKNQPRKAEAMARRGLTVSQDASRRRALWQLILKSGQAQNNARVIREAQQSLR